MEFLMQIGVLHIVSLEESCQTFAHLLNHKATVEDYTEWKDLQSNNLIITSTN